MRRFGVGVLVLISALCLLLSSTSLWTRRNVINTEVFVSNAETVLREPAVQARITGAVTTQVMATPEVQQAVDSAVQVLPPGLQRFRSSVEDGVRSLVAKGVSLVLTSDVFANVTDAALTSAHDQLVNGQPVRFTLGQAKARLPDSARTGLAGQVLALVPDNLGVTVVTPADAPRLYNAVDLLKSLWLWTGLLALALLAAALGLSRRRRGTLRAWSITLTVLVLVLLVTLRVTRGQLLVAVKPENRDAVSAVWDVVGGSLRAWNLWLLAIALFILVETLVWGHLGIVSGIRRGARAAQEQVRRHREARVTRVAVSGGGDGSGVVEEEVTVVAEPRQPWPRRVAAATQAFVQGLAVNEQVVRLGAFVRRHQGPAQWTGVVVAALVLLFWPAPTLSVLIWIAALVALYLGLLHWLVDQAAPQPTGTAVVAPGAAEVEPAVPAAPTAAPAVPAAPTAAPAVPEQAGVPVSRAAATPVDGAARDGAVGDGAAAGQPAGATTAVAAPAAPAVPQPRAPEPAAMSAEGLHNLSDRLDLLLRLGAARESGVLTDDEFAREKGRLLIP